MSEKDRTVEPHPMLFDHYEVIRVLGRGAMGIVYLARDIRIGRLAALKTLNVDQLPRPGQGEAEDYISSTGTSQRTRPRPLRFYPHVCGGKSWPGVRFHEAWRSDFSRSSRSASRCR